MMSFRVWPPGPMFLWGVCQLRRPVYYGGLSTRRTGDPSTRGGVYGPWY